MRFLALMACLAAFASPVPAEAKPARTAVFDIELLDLSQEAGPTLKADEARRLAAVSTELRRLLGASDQIDVIDTAPQAAALKEKAPLFKCNGCEEDIAKALGADLSVSGHVQKTSNLILSFVITIKDVATGKVIRAGQADIRGNTDESWIRGLRWIVKNRLLAEPLPTRS
jgi:hypothetical protein